MNVDFSDKVILVTGASSGIGESTALLFAKLNAKLALVGRNAANLAAVAKQCQQQKGLKPLEIVADLATDAGCEKTAKDTIAHYGRLDILINNAGVGVMTTLQTTDMEKFDQVFNLNVRGVYNLTRLLVPEIIKSKGNIVNVSSIVATMVSTEALPYSMTKAALDHFTRLISLELAPKGVRVNAVSPGVTQTRFVTRIKEGSDEMYNEFLKNVAQVIPLRKVCVGDDIAQMIAFIASDNCSLVTGTVVEVDGGTRFTGLGGTYKDQ